MNDENEMMLVNMGEIYGKAISPSAAKLFISQFEGYDENVLRNALMRCIRELRHFPTIADILDRIDDGHPSPDEAWALIPKSEMDTACLTKEMISAWALCRDLLSTGDNYGARLAFIGAYKNLIAISKSKKEKAIWKLSLGHDKAKRDVVINEAIRAGKLEAQKVSHLLTYKENENQSNVSNINQIGVQKLIASFTGEKNEAK